MAALLALILVSLTAAVAVGQGPLPDPTGRSGEPPPLLREEPRPIPLPRPILPPPPSLPPAKPGQLPLARVFVREIRIVGSTVFSAEELAQITRPYVNRDVTSEELEALRLALTVHYVRNGYVNSGAILPDQTVVDDVITFQIIEGALTQVEVEGNRWFRSGYIQKRLTLGAGPPLNVNDLQEQLRLLQQDPRIQRVNAQLRPGVRPGEGVLDVRVEDRQPFKLLLEFNNYQAPSIGAERGTVTVEDHNLFGLGDALAVRYGRSGGVTGQWDVRYSIPVTARDTTFALSYRHVEFKVVDPAFEALDIRSESEILGVTLRHPVYRTVEQEVALEVTGERLSNQTFLLDEPFTLSAGARKGESIVTAIRFAQEWIHRTTNQVIAVRSRFSFGIDALGATMNETSKVPDGKFVAWLGQGQWVRRLFWDTEAILRADLQWTDEALLSLEQISLGGRYTVRGYRENTLIRDNGLVTSLELRIPIVRNRWWADYLEVAPFLDYARGWNSNRPPPIPEKLGSVGLGLRWGVTTPGPLKPQFEVYWGNTLWALDRSVRGPEDRRFQLQDHGLHLQFALAAF